MIELLLEAERALSVGLLDRAEILYGQVASADPRNSIAVVGLARVQLDRGDDERALELSRRALRIDPENAAAQRMVARIEEVMEYRNGVEELEAGEVVEATDEAPDKVADDPAAEPTGADADGADSDDGGAPPEIAEPSTDVTLGGQASTAPPWAAARVNEPAASRWAPIAQDAGTEPDGSAWTGGYGDSELVDLAPAEEPAAAPAASPDWPDARPSAQAASGNSESARTDRAPALDPEWSPEGAEAGEPSGSGAVRAWLDRVFRRPPR